MQGEHLFIFLNINVIYCLEKASQGTKNQHRADIYIRSIRSKKATSLKLLFNTSQFTFQCAIFFVFFCGSLLSVAPFCFHGEKVLACLVTVVFIDDFGGQSFQIQTLSNPNCSSSLLHISCYQFLFTHASSLIPQCKIFVLF